MNPSALLVKLLPTLLAVGLSPWLLGIINRTKARFGGRVGPPLVQPYYDLFRLLGKGAVYSETTTWLFRAGPIVALAALLTFTCLVPLGGLRAPLAFRGDIILAVYLLGLARLFMVLAALDTGSAFEGMGASREVFFSALAEPALLLGLAAIEREVGRLPAFTGDAGMLSLSDIHEAMSASVWAHGSMVVALVAVTLVVVFLAENSRIPVDDPNTHLELTMIHEVIVLDHSGPDLAFIMWGKALKLWGLGSLIVGIVIPARSGNALLDTGVAVAGLCGLAVMIGAIESTMARLRMPRVPQWLIGATALAGLALVLEYRG